MHSFISQKRVAFHSLVAKFAIPLDALLRHLDVAALRGQRREGEARAHRRQYLSMRSSGIDDVALRLRHLLAVLVADQRVDVDRA